MYMYMYICYITEHPILETVYYLGGPEFNVALLDMCVLRNSATP